MKNESLLKNYLFSFSLFGGLAIAVVASTIIYFNNDLYRCGKIVCFSYFLDAFDFPIKIASAGFALAGFAAILHRSEQTRQQLEHSISQNIFKNYIDHKNEFMVNLTLLESDNAITIKNKSTLYKNLFPYNNIQNVEFTSKGKRGERSDLLFRIEEYNKLVTEFNDIPPDFGEPTRKDDLKVFAQWISEYLVFSSKIQIEPHPDKLLKIGGDWKGIISSKVFKGVPEDMEDFIYIGEKVLTDLSSFSFPSELDGHPINTRHLKKNLTIQMLKCGLCEK
jgi:hypothetical protein